MHKFLRKNSHVIVWVVVVAFVAGMGGLGIGTYITGRSGATNGGQAFASVNGKAINYATYQQRVSQASYQLSSMPDAQALGYRYDILNSMIDRDLLLQEAKKQRIKVTVPDEDVDEYINEIKEQYQLDDAKLEEALQAQNMTIAQWKEEIRGLLAEDQKIEALMEKAIGDIEVTDEEVVAEYEEVRFSNVFVNKMDSGQGKVRAEKALAEINGGENFANVVKEYSEAGNTDKDGDLGWFKRSAYLAEDNQLTKVAFGLEVGEVSEIVETETGYHILKVTDKKIAEGEEYQEEKANIRANLYAQKKETAEKEWFDDLKSEAKIKINAPHLAGYKALVEQDFETAAEKFEEAAELTPESDLYLGFLAAAYRSLEQPEKALEVTEKAIKVNPTNWQNYYSAARLYQDKEQVETVKEMLIKAGENAGDEYMAIYQIRELASQIGATDIVEVQDAALEEISKKIKAQQEAEQKAAQEAESANE